MTRYKVTELRANYDSTLDEMPHVYLNHEAEAGRTLVDWKLLPDDCNDYAGAIVITATNPGGK